MHIFLTGMIQSGKSTAINRALYAAGIKPLGFRTRPGEYDEDGSSRLYIIPAMQSVPFGSHNCIADRRSGGRNKVFTEVFDTEGVDILRKSEGGLILMDELGFMESNAEEFKAEVFRRLDGDAPILGVVRDRETEFLDAVREHEKVELWWLTEENREELSEMLTARLRGLNMQIAGST